eukprot:m.389974 g.389974  ORF g.389974 m.389974 type:complete len:283 (-) comp20074_c1_seq2:399-1247(-)
MAVHAVVCAIVAVLFRTCNAADLAFGNSPCPGGGTVCPADAACCQMHSPDLPRVTGHYGCAPVNSTSTGCAGGGISPDWKGCCCAPGPANISSSTKNVLIIGDSVSVGYTPFVRANLSGLANVQHGPDNASGGNADGTAYGVQCINYFLRTPKLEPVAWDVVTFNFGLHDGGTDDADYEARLLSIAKQIKASVPPTAKPIYFLTTPFLCTAASDAVIVRQNAIAKQIMVSLDIPVLDLHTPIIRRCGLAPQPNCSIGGCPHYEPDGYALLTSYIAAAVRKLL